RAAINPRMTSTHSSPANCTHPRLARGSPGAGGCARLWMAALLLALMRIGAPAQEDKDKTKGEEVTQAYLREHYTKFEYRIPMRDSVKLFTAVYEPKDDAQPYPILLTR